ncbi:MAG: hypothetical protein AB1792_08430 [Candidatus Zixiibacteriota bacterium]
MTPHRHNLSAAFLGIAWATIVLGAGATEPSAQVVKIQKLGGGRFMSESVQQIPVPGISKLHLIGSSNLGGTVTLTTRPVDSVRVELVKVFRVPSADMAYDWERLIACDLVLSDSILTIDLKAQSNAPWQGSEWSARAEVTVTIPPDWDINVGARFFEFDLAGPFGAAVVDTEFGRVKLQRVTRRTSVTGSYTAIELAEVRGEISAQTSYADLEVRGAISAAERAARLVNTSGSISVRGLAGAVDVETENAPVTLSDLVLVGSESSLRGSNAPIEAEIIEFGDAQLEVRNGNAPVSLKVPRSLSARLNLVVGIGGRIHTEGLIVQTHPNQLRTGRLEGVCGSGQGLIDVDVSGFGRIDLTGR